MRLHFCRRNREPAESWFDLLELPFGRARRFVAVPVTCRRYAACSESTSAMTYRCITFVFTLLLLLGESEGLSADSRQQESPSPISGKKSKQQVAAKDDIEAIGNRDIGGGKGVGNWYSLESEMRMGREYAQMIEQTVKVVKDPVIAEYVNRIGQNLARNSDAKVPFTIKVIDSDEVNAFALPGGFFYVNTGLLLVADEEAELAGVMAHEIAHVAARHAMRQMTRANLANLASIPLIVLGGGIGYAARSAAGLGVPISLLKFSRGFEEEADYFGMQYMFKTGYDPQSFLNFFEKINALEKKKAGTLSKIFASHPPIESRVEKIQAQTNTRLPDRSQYVITTSEFDEVRSRLALLEKRGRARDQNDENRPTLRRQAKEGDSATTGDDRPTLKRRQAE